MEKRYVDLHIHSTASDGKLSVEEIMDLAVKLKVSTISVTDHDTIKVYRGYINKYSEKEINIIPGVEVTTVYKNQFLHILVYKFNINGRFAKCIDDLEKKNLRYLLDYKKNKTNVFFREYADTISLLELVKQDGATSVLAHPPRIHLRYSKLNLLVAELKSKGLDGIESYHKDNSLIDRILLNYLARKYSLITTGGSDFHDYKDNLGRIHSNRKLSMEMLLKNKKVER